MIAKAKQNLLVPREIRKGGMVPAGIPSDLFDIFPSRQEPFAGTESENNTVRDGNNSQCLLSLRSDKMALESEISFLLDLVQIGICQQQDPLMNAPESNTLGKKSPSTIKASSPKEREWRETQDKKSQSTRNTISYCTLNKLMERTARTRCLLLEETEEGNKVSEPLMRSLSASAFKTIMSSTSIKSSTSARSFENRNNNNGSGDENKPSDALTRSDFINSSFDLIVNKSQERRKKQRPTPEFDLSSFDQTINESQERRKKQWPTPEFDLSLFTSNSAPLRASEEIKQKTKPLINSLPSCGSLESLESASSESGNHFDKGVQRSSSSLPIKMSAPPLEVFRNGSCQTKRKFNSFETHAIESCQSSRHPCRDFSGDDLQRIVQLQSNKKSAGKISQTMRLVLRRELERSVAGSNKVEKKCLTNGRY